MEIINDLCPKCKSDDLIFGPFTLFDGNSGFYEVYCQNRCCAFSGRQWIKLVFDFWQEWSWQGKKYIDMYTGEE